MSKSETHIEKARKMKFQSFGQSDIGSSRPNNEDVWIALQENQFFALADGIGGHKAGEIAAQETIENLANHFPLKIESNSDLIIEQLHKAICRTNHWVNLLGKRYKDFNRMGTTLCCLFFHRDLVIYAHVGDSRIYRYRNGHLDKLTEDHSALRDWLTKTAREDSPSSPQPLKNIITRAIGVDPQVQPEIAQSKIEKGDIYFLCSDGLSDFITERKMEEILSKTLSIEESVKSFIQTAKENDSNDNITVVMIQIEDLHERADLSG